ncbi:MAG: hypothetical protein R3B89_06670 [Polyangiaceae bacterium]
MEARRPQGASAARAIEVFPRHFRGRWRQLAQERRSGAIACFDGECSLARWLLKTCVFQQSAGGASISV